MKLLKKYLLQSLAAPLLFPFLSFTNAVAGETVIIRTYETTDATVCKGTAKILITEKGQTRQLPLESLSYNGKQPEKELQILETIQGILDQYHNQGFKIVSSNSQVYCGTITTYILTK
jgi:hypothetical protein